MAASILLVDDDHATRFAFSRYFSNAGYTIHTAPSLSEGQNVLPSKRFEALLLDLNLPDGNGIDWITEVRKNNPSISIIIITGSGDIPLAVEAMRRGADHFLTKPINLTDLEVFLKKSLELESLRRKDVLQRATTRKEEPFFGESPVIKKVLELSTLVAENESVVLLQGDTGTGKGVLARWIHEHSSRSGGPYVEVNCASLRGELLSSELFGHAKGAFTSAVQDRQGLIGVADGGTLFLDEIGDMDPGVQAQFLKAIEEKSYRRLGEAKERKSDFRLVCATNQDLPREVERGRFRSDLFFRICVFPINLPMLRERLEDLPALAQHLLKSLRTPTPELLPESMDLLVKYNWPGNIRELRNMLERALLLSRGQPIAPCHFPGLENPRVTAVSIPDSLSSLDDVEKVHIQRTLDKYNGDTQKASRALGISRASLYRRVNKIKSCQPASPSEPNFQN